MQEWAPSAVAIYCRISDDREGAGLGVARQQADCRAYCERRGWPVAQVFVDNDTSAYSGRARPQYRRMLDAVKDGRCDGVVVWHLDRLHRRPVELEEFFAICDAAGVRALGTCFGDIDLATDEGRFMARILGAVAAKESADKSRRIRRKAAELAAAGRPHGGLAPFGLTSDWSGLVPVEAAVLRDAAERILAGESLRSIAIDLRARGVLTRYGKPFHISAVRKLLISPTVAGLRSVGGQPGVDASWPAILDRITWERVRAILLDPGRQRFNPANARAYLLTGGLAVCGLCGANLVARPKDGGKRCYTCASGIGFHGCGKIRRLADPVEAEVLARAQIALDTPELAARRRNRDTEDLTATLVDEITDHERRLERLAADHYANQMISRAEYLAARQAIDQRLLATRRRLAALTRAEAVDIPDGLDLTTLDLHHARAVVAVIIEAVVIHPVLKGRKRFDPTAIEIRWRV